MRKLEKAGRSLSLPEWRIYMAVQPPGAAPELEGKAKEQFGGPNKN